MDPPGGRLASGGARRRRARNAAGRRCGRGRLPRDRGDARRPDDSSHDPPGDTEQPAVTRTPAAPLSRSTDRPKQRKIPSGGQPMTMTFEKARAWSMRLSALAAGAGLLTLSAGLALASAPQERQAQ